MSNKSHINTGQRMEKKTYSFFMMTLNLQFSTGNRKMKCNRESCQTNLPSNKCQILRIIPLLSNKVLFNSAENPL